MHTSIISCEVGLKINVKGVELESLESRYRTYIHVNISDVVNRVITQEIDIDIPDETIQITTHAEDQKGTRHLLYNRSKPLISWVILKVCLLT